MAVPTAYTEAEFSDYLQKALGATADFLVWSTDRQSFDEVINDTLLSMGETDVENVEDIQALRVIGKLYLWRAVAAEVAAKYDFSADGGSYSRSQLLAHAQAMIAEAERAAMPYDSAYSVMIDSATYHRDPYADFDDSLTAGIDDYLAELRAS